MYDIILQAIIIYYCAVNEPLEFIFYRYRIFDWPFVRRIFKPQPNSLHNFRRTRRTNWTSHVVTFSDKNKISDRLRNGSLCHKVLHWAREGNSTTCLLVFSWLSTLCCSQPINPPCNIGRSPPLPCEMCMRMVWTTFYVTFVVHQVWLI